MGWADHNFGQEAEEYVLDFLLPLTVFVDLAASSEIEWIFKHFNKIKDFLWRYWWATRLSRILGNGEWQILG